MAVENNTNIVKSILRKTRSIRRFRNNERIQPETLNDLIELTRYCPSGGNRQPLSFLCITKKEECHFVTTHVKWAALLSDWNGPEADEEPPAYICVMVDRKIAENAPYDSGIAAHAILMGASERGMGGCIIGNINKEHLYEYFGISTDRFKIDLILAIGLPAEEVIIEEAEDKTAYYRDQNRKLHVPKRKLSDLLN